jgi:hypothetical protein
MARLHPDEVVADNPFVKVTPLEDYEVELIGRTSPKPEDIVPNEHDLADAGPSHAVTPPPTEAWDDMHFLLKTPSIADVSIYSPTDDTFQSSSSSDSSTTSSSSLTSNSTTQSDTMNDFIGQAMAIANIEPVNSFSDMSLGKPWQGH